MTRRTLAGIAVAVPIAWAAGAAAQEASRDVTIVLPEQPGNLEPCGSIMTNVGQVISQNITESLTVIDPASGEPQPKLATSWERIDDLTWRFSLRENVSFQDGTPFDAQAVKFSIERMTGGTFTCNNIAKFGNAELTVTPVDSHTVEIKTDTPQPILPTLLSVAMVVSPATPADQAVNDPVGTGPYRLATFTPQTAVLERVEGYWNGTPEVAKATYVWRRESSIRAAMVETGEADLTPSIAIQDATNPDTDFAYLNSETTAIRFDTTLAPLDDVRVRKALNLAIDWEGLGGLFGDDVLRASQMVVPGINGHNPDLAPWPYDPEQAAQLIEEAEGDGVPVDTEITLYGRNGIYPNGNEALEAMVAMWQEAGLNVSLTMLDVVDWTRYMQKPFPEERGPNLVQIMHDNNKGDAAFTIPIFYRSDGLYSSLTDTALDAEIDRAMAATDAERTKAFQTIFAEVHDRVVSDAPMFHMIGYTRVGPRLDWRPSINTNSEIALADIRFKD
ncbi:ABC transporter substrate-binding protein [Marinivivus vitaminiproducens]|uniref:ABC transporter substrate-binding protein n=1 Tax=Marinivivus vitaminiproducens TaxID=3035935 RepID=UPI0027A7C1BF|nr:ABC transporter substrate-binding protein [Geminicoccaceae bacterium SCSIO 64248]